MGNALADKQVSLDEIRTFDNDAQDLVQQYHEAGWTSRRSSKGHVIAYAPDGKTSASISRDSLRGRSGRNAAAPLKKWLRDQQTTKGAAFGITDLDEATAPIEARFGGEVPVRITQQVQSDPRLIEYLTSLADQGIDPFAERIAIGGGKAADGTSLWYAVDVVAAKMIIHSPDLTFSQACEHAREQGMLPAESTEADVKVYRCSEPGCGKEYPNAQQMDFHRRRIHDGYPCPDCDHAHFGSGSALAAHREKEHGVLRKHTIAKAQDQGRWCSECAKAFDSPGAYRSHLGRVHTPAEGTRPEQVLAAMATIGGTVSVDALIEHLGWKRNLLASPLKRLSDTGQLVRVAKAQYRLPDEVTVTHTEPRDVPVTSPPVTPARDTEDDTRDVPGTSPVSDLTNLLVELPDGDSAVEMIAKIRAVVTPPLLAQLREVTAERDRLAHDLDIMTKERDDMKARVQLLNEAFRALGDD
jgi:hypothetical protein